MTLGELKEKLSGFEDNMRVVVYREENGPEFYEIDDIGPSKGTPSRLPGGEASFSFDQDGPQTWLFISVSAA